MLTFGWDLVEASNCAIAILCVCEHLGKDMCTSPPLFHVLTGCDTTFFFGGKSQNSASIRNSYPEANEALFFSLLNIRMSLLNFHAHSSLF